jgi:PD-(D/E)XK nuclease superfamily
VRLKEQLHEMRLPSRARPSSELRRALRSIASAIRRARNQGKWNRAHFDLLETLGYTRLENAHSRVLRWLLDPNESHGLGDQFLSGFLGKLAPRQRLETRGVQVQCERPISGGRVDVLVSAPSWRLVVENKIRCAEHDDQTVRYARHYKQHRRPGSDLFLVFLTPKGIKPLSDDFRPMSYATIRELLESVAPRGSAEHFVQQFAEHIYYDVEE